MNTIDIQLLSLIRKMVSEKSPAWFSESQRHSVLVETYSETLADIAKWNMAEWRASQRNHRILAWAVGVLAAGAGVCALLRFL